MNDFSWKQIGIHLVGGLFQIGYAENSDLLLVLSLNGRGLFDCLTGQKIARDREDSQETFDETTLIAKGFDLLDGQEIKTAGLFGGTLSTKTRDGWNLSIRELSYNMNGVYLNLENSDDEMLIADDKISEIRAFGFSETEKTFVIATNSDLTIFSR